MSHQESVRVLSEDVNPLIKVKRRAKHGASPAYPPRALVELVINQLVHRDYERSETASIDIEPSRGITFKNPGGLPESVVKRVKPNEAGLFRAVPNVSDLRNRSLCDVFFGIQAIEREGTGLSDVEELARDHGGDTVFTHDAKSRCFTAQILQPVASAGSKTIARDDRPVGMYVFNVLPFVSLPEHVSIARLRMPWKDWPADVSLSEAGTFVAHDGALWSFVPLPILSSTLAAIVDAEASQAPLRTVIENDPEQRKILSWLLR
jgi:hypothetical protein